MHEPNQFDLLKQRRFAPFFWTQALGAGNDNIYKNALVIFVAYKAASLTSIDANTLVNLAAAIFIAPFVLFSATSGQVADKFEKSRLIRYIKVLEIAIMLIGLVGFWQRSLALLFVALALMGLHSTLFGPVKYAILPQHLKIEELVGGNGLVEMGTFVAILVGTIAGGLLVAVEPDGPVLAGAAAVIVAVAGWLASRAIPHTPAAAPGLADQLEPVHRNLEEPEVRAGQPRRLAVDAGHLLVLVLRRDVPYAVPELRQGRAGRRRTRRHVPAGELLHRHRRRLALVRAAVRASRRTGTRAVRLDRPHAVRRRPVVRDARDARHDVVRRRRLSRAAGPLASHRGPGADRPLRRLLHRSPLRADPGALGGHAPLADHRCQQHPECAVHGRVRGPCDRVTGGRRVDTRPVPRHRHPQRVRRVLHLHARSRIPDAVPGLAADPHDVPRAEGRARECSGEGHRASSCAIT